ncbi:hypothetical protein IGK19_000524 [Enterococcus sp. DIV0837a]
MESFVSLNLTNNTNKKAGSTMDHLYIKYIHQFSVLVLGTLIIVGIVAFIIQGRDILTVHQEFFSYAFGIPQSSP